MTDRKIASAVITGPTGAVGSALCRALIEKGIEVYAVVRPGTNRISALPTDKKIHIVACDVSNIGTLPEKINGGADAFFHLAWANTTGTGRNDMYAQTENIRSTLDAVHAARGLGCGVFLGAGSQAEYGRFEGALRADTPAFPENGYGMAKLCAGEMSRVECEKLGMDHIWVRILSVYGPRDGMRSMIMSTIEKLLKGEKPALTLGLQQWDYLYSSDAAEALYLCAEKGVNGKIYPVGSGMARPLKEYIEIMRDAIDPNAELGFGDIPYGAKQVMYLKADINELTRDTGFMPKVSFENGISNTIDWVRGEVNG